MKRVLIAIFFLLPLLSQAKSEKLLRPSQLISAEASQHYIARGERLEKVLSKNLNHYFKSYPMQIAPLLDQQLGQLVLRQRPFMDDTQLLEKQVQVVAQTNSKSKLSGADRTEMTQKMLGLLFTLDAEARFAVGRDLENIFSLRRLLLANAVMTEFNLNTNITLHDIWWDFTWLRAYNYPLDLSELVAKKIAFLESKSDGNLARTLKSFRESLLLFVVRQSNQIVLNQEKPTIIQLRLIDELIPMLERENDLQTVKDLLPLRYRALVKSGLTLEANWMKNQLVWDQFDKRWQAIFATNISLSSRINRAVMVFVYLIGALLTATPLELFVIGIAIWILYRQGLERFQFIHSRSTRRRHFKDYFRISTRRRTLLWLLRARLRPLGFAWKMFVATYTGTQVPFSAKVASSLLIFGIGLYFNAARNLVESVIAQIAL